MLDREPIVDRGFTTRLISFSSRLPPDECARRLAEATRPDKGGWYEDLDRSDVVLARISGDRVRLRVRRPYVRNFLAPLFYGRLQPSSTGTSLKGRFITHPGVVAFLVAWFALPFMIAAVMFIREGVLLPALMVVAAALLIWLLARLGRSERQEIEDLVRRVLDASPD